MMMPVIRISDDVFRRLQNLATPLVDTPASVIERLLDSHESSVGTKKLPAGSGQSVAADPPPDLTTANISYETYENTSNRHVTIHKADCSQLRKRGGVHRHGQGGYKGHPTFAEAKTYAESTGLPIEPCGYCQSPIDDDTARELVIDFVRKNPNQDWQQAEIKRNTGVAKKRVRSLLWNHPDIDQTSLATGAVRWKPRVIVS